MPDSFLQFVLRDTEWDPFRKIREHIIGMTPRTGSKNRWLDSANFRCCGTVEVVPRVFVLRAH